MKRILFIIICCLPVVLPGATAIKQGALHVLANDRLRLEVDPALGGRIVSMTALPSGVAVTDNPSISVSPAGSGLLSDRIRRQRGKPDRSYETSAYEVITSGVKGNQAFLTLRRSVAPLTVEKTITITDGSLVARVDYALSNPTKKDFAGSFWSCNLAGGSKKWRVSFPEGDYADRMNAELQKSGVVFSSDDPQPGNFFVTDPQRDFMAAGNGKKTLVLIAPFPVLDTFYSCMPLQIGLNPTLEYWTTPFVLKPLAFGKEDAVNHPEEEDPLARYYYRFTMELVIVPDEHYDALNFRPLATAEKDTRYLPRVEEAPGYTEFTTPAIPFLVNPERKIKLLALAKSTTVPELFEFNRRFATRMAIVELMHPHNFRVNTYLAWTPPEPGSALEKALESTSDVMLVSSVRETKLPAELLKKIQDAVSAGMGFVYVSHRNEFPSLIPSQGGTPLVLPGTIPYGIRATAYKFGKGNVVFVESRIDRIGRFWTQENALLPVGKAFNESDKPYWEYVFATFGKIIRFAANDVPKLEIKSVKVNADSLEIDTPETSQLRVELVTPDGRTRELEAPYRLDNLTLNGHYFVNVFLSDGEYDCDYYSLDFNHQTAVGIEELTLERFAHEAGAPIKGSVTLRGVGDMELKLRDGAGRVLAKETRENVSGIIPFSMIPVLAPANIIAQVEVFLRRDNVLVDEAKASFTVAPTTRRKLNFVLWGSTKGHFYQRFDEFEKVGFNVLTGGFKPSLDSVDSVRAVSEKSLRANMRIAPMSMHRIALNKIDSIVRDPCLRSTKELTLMRKEIGETVEKYKDFSPFTYYSADENSLGHYNTAHDLCQSPECLAAFRIEMKKKYGTLEALNSVWETTFASWEDVRPDTFSEANERDVYNAWADHRNFMMFAVSDTLKLMKKELVACDPHARLGFSGQLIANIHGAFNWLEALKVVDDPTAYLRENDGLVDLIRSIRRPGAGGAGAWISSNTSTLPHVRWRYFNQIVNGLFSPSYWCGNYFIRRGDGQLSPEGEYVRKTLLEIRRSGLEQMFAEGHEKSAPITVVYSLPSLVAARISGETSAFTLSAFTQSFHGWTMLVRDMGFLPPRVLDSKALVTVTPDEYPVLVLPMLQVLSDAEISVLERYVEAGGVLITDAQAGRYDAFNRERAPGGTLEKLFGLRVTPAVGSGDGSTVFYDKHALPLSAPGGSVVQTSGDAWGSLRKISPETNFGGMKLAGSDREVGKAFFFKSLGKGKTLYLNVLLSEYPVLRSRNQAASAISEVMREVFVRLGIHPPHIIAPGCTLAEYTGDGNRYFGLVQNAIDVPGQSELRFGEKVHLYDTLKHHYLAFTDQFTVALPVYEPCVLAALPKKLDSINVLMKKDAGKIVLNIVATPGVTTLVRIDVTRDGKLLPEYTGNHRVRGKGSIILDQGLEPQGNLVIAVTDIFSGAKQIINDD